MSNNNYSIKGFIKTSFIDWPGRLCSVLFLGGCGFRCVMCHNAALVSNADGMPDYPLQDAMAYLELRKSWIDGVTVTGGEPTLRRDLPELLKKIRRLGLAIKLDTNGSNPGMLESLIARGLVDAVFMDVKAPLTDESYSRIAGTPVRVAVIKRSIDLLKRSGIEVTFRTTVVPGLVEEPELALITEALGDVPSFVIQAFRNVETLDTSLRGVQEFNPARVESMRERFAKPSRSDDSAAAYSILGIAS